MVKCPAENFISSLESSIFDLRSIHPSCHQPVEEFPPVPDELVEVPAAAACDVLYERRLDDATASQAPMEDRSRGATPNSQGIALRDSRRQVGRPVQILRPGLGAVADRSRAPIVKV